jgi:hypothetical protein
VALARKVDDPPEVLLVRDALGPYAAEVRPLLWPQAKEGSTPAGERFRLLAILATLDPEGSDWPPQAGSAVEQFLGANPLHLGAWKAALEPVRGPLRTPLAEAFRASTEPERRRLIATLLADYAADQPEVLTDLLLDADETCSRSCVSPGWMPPTGGPSWQSASGSSCARFGAAAGPGPGRGRRPC